MYGLVLELKRLVELRQKADRRLRDSVVERRIVLSLGLAVAVLADARAAGIKVDARRPAARLELAVDRARCSRAASR
jgi:hypothetical protein